MTTHAPDRPQGRQQVVRALKDAARDLLREKGSRFSVREVAERARVNHALIYRHFGSKENLITATMAEAARNRLADLRSGRSPVEIYTRDTPESATILARLIMDGDTDLVATHPVMDALVAMAAADDRPPRRPPAEIRAAVAGALILGWAMFGDFLGPTAGVECRAEATELVDRLVSALLSGGIEIPEAQADPPTRDPQRDR